MSNVTLQALKRAMEFYRIASLPMPIVSISEQGEICFEWKHEGRHATVDFDEEDGGYSLLDVDRNKYVAGKYDMGQQSGIIDAASEVMNYMRDERIERWLT